MSKYKSTEGLFSRYRDYEFISNIEFDFFSELSKNKGQFSGREKPGIDNLSVAGSLANAMPFLSDKGGSVLSTIVSFDITKSRKRVDLDSMFLGTMLKPSKKAEEQQVTHFIALSKGDECHLKLHLDLDFDLGSPEPKPSPHFQVGGRALKVNNRAFSMSWEKGLDKPRWPSLPFCTPLLWHAAFLEFQECESVQIFVNQSWWRNLVKKAELSLWKDFANDMNSNLGKSSIIEALYPPPRK